MYKKYMVACSKCGGETPRFTTRKYECHECRYYKKSFHLLSKKLRNGGVCQICGDTVRLCVHHKDINKHNDSLDNLMVVCIQCHKSIHGHGLLMPKAVKWGKCGKRLVYKTQEKLASRIDRDERWGHVFIKNNKYLITMIERTYA